MSKNNTIRKSDKKFIRREKARIRAQFFDFKKQEEKITELYSLFLKKPIVKSVEVKEKKEETKLVETKKGSKSKKVQPVK